MCMHKVDLTIYAQSLTIRELGNLVSKIILANNVIFVSITS